MIHTGAARQQRPSLRNSERSFVRSWPQSRLPRHTMCVVSIPILAKPRACLTRRGWCNSCGAGSEHSAALWNTQEHTATHCKTLATQWRYCATRSNDMYPLSALRHAATHCDTRRHTATHCNTLQHTATRCSTLQHTATHCSTLQHTATRYNTLQHTAAR